jgi:hypothetical protein
MSAVETSAVIAQYSVHAYQLSFYACNSSPDVLYIKTLKSVIKKAAFNSQNSDKALPDERLSNWMRHCIAYVWIRIEPCTTYDQ